MPSRERGHLFMAYIRGEAREADDDVSRDLGRTDSTRPHVSKLAAFSSQSNSPKLATFAPLFKHLPTAHAPVVTHRRARVRQCFADPPALFLARIVDHLHISDLHMAVLGIAFFHVCIGGRILGVFFQVMRGRVGHDSRG